MKFLMYAKEWFKTLSTFYRYAIAIVLLLIHFSIWHIHMPEVAELQSFGLKFVTVMLLLGYVLALHKVDPKEDIKSVGFILVLLLVLLWNTTKIILDFNGIVVDMGFRSEELIMEAFPSFILTILVFRGLTKKAFDLALGFLLLLLIGYASIVVFGYFNEETMWFGFQIGTIDGRWQSILNNSNALGEYNFIGIFIILYFMTVFKDYWKKFLIAIPLPIFLVSLILSGSRTAMLMVVVAIGIWVLYYFFHTKRNQYMILLFFLACGILYFLSKIGLFDALFEYLRNDTSLSGRDIIWKNSLEIIEQNLKHGIGYNNFTYVYNEMFRTITSPHNMLLGVFAEFGVLGFIIVIGWFTFIIIKNQNALVKFPENPDKSRLIVFNMFYIAFFIGQMTEYAFLKSGAINTFFLSMVGFNGKILYDLYPHKEKTQISSLVLAVYIVVIYFIKLPIPVMVSLMIFGSFMIVLVDYILLHTIKKIKRMT